MSHQTLADNLRSFLPPQERENLGLLEEAPRPLNLEAVDVILSVTREAAEGGFGGVMLFLDGTLDKYGQVKDPYRYYEASVVLSMLSGSDLGFEVDDEDTVDGLYVTLRWSEFHPLFCYKSEAITVEVSPPDGYIPSYLLDSSYS